MQNAAEGIKSDLNILIKNLSEHFDQEILQQAEINLNANFLPTITAEHLKALKTLFTYASRIHQNLTNKPRQDLERILNTLFLKLENFKHSDLNIMINYFREKQASQNDSKAAYMIARKILNQPISDVDYKKALQYLKIASRAKGTLIQQASIETLLKHFHGKTDMQTLILELTQYSDSIKLAYVLARLSPNLRPNLSNYFGNKQETLLVHELEKYFAHNDTIAINILEKLKKQCSYSLADTILTAIEHPSFQQDGLTVGCRKFIELKAKLFYSNYYTDSGHIKHLFSASNNYKYLGFYIQPNQKIANLWKRLQTDAYEHNLEKENIFSNLGILQKNKTQRKITQLTTLGEKIIELMTVISQLAAHPNKNNIAIINNHCQAMNRLLNHCLGISHVQSNQDPLLTTTIKNIKVTPETISNAIQTVDSVVSTVLENKTFESSTAEFPSKRLSIN